MPWWESGLLIIIFFVVMVAMALWAAMRHGPDTENELARHRMHAQAPERDREDYEGRPDL